MYKIKLSDGKYEITNNNGDLNFYRYGEYWESATETLKYYGVVLSLIEKIEELETKLNS